MLKLLAYRKTAVATLTLARQLWFSVEEEALKKQQALERALWASAFIRIIRDSDPKEALKGKSLKDLLLEAKIGNVTNLTSNRSQQIEEEMKQYFNKGVQFKKYIYTQERFNMASTITSKQQLVYIFNPSFTITKGIFLTLDTLRQKRLLFGNQGVGKSASFALYKELSHHIRNYIEMYANEAQQTKKILQSHIKRVVYLSISIDLSKDLGMFQTELIQKILKQVPNFKQKIKDKKYNQIIQFLKNQNVLFVIDQINVLASYYKKWNSRKNYSAEQIAFLQAINRIPSKVDMQKIQKIRDYIKTISYQSIGYCIFNSSINIQKSVIYKVKGSPYSDKSMDLVDPHGGYLEIRLSYHHKIKTLEGQEDFKQIIWNFYEILLRTFNFHKQEKQILELKKDFKKVIANYTFENYCSMLNVRQAFQKKQISQIQYPNCTQHFRNLLDHPQKRDKLFNQTLSQIKICGRNTFINNVANNFRNSKKNFLARKLVFFAQVYQLAKVKSMDESLKNKPFEISQLSRNYLEQKIFRDMVQFEKNDQLNKELLCYEQIKVQNQTKLILYLSPIEFCRTYQQIISKCLQEFSSALSGQQNFVFNKIFQTSNTAFGILMEFLMLRIIYNPMTRYSHITLNLKKYLHHSKLIHQEIARLTTLKNKNSQEQDKQFYENRIKEQNRKLGQNLNQCQSMQTFTIRDLFKTTSYQSKKNEKKRQFLVNNSPPLEKEETSYADFMLDLIQETNSLKSANKTSTENEGSNIQQDNKNQQIDYAVIFMNSQKMINKNSEVFNKGTNEDIDIRKENNEGIDWMIANYAKHEDNVICFNSFDSAMSQQRDNIQCKIQKAVRLINGYHFAIEQYVKSHKQNEKRSLKSYKPEIKFVHTIICLGQHFQFIKTKVKKDAKFTNALKLLNSKCEIRLANVETIHIIETKSQSIYTDIFKKMQEQLGNHPKKV